MRMKRGSIQPRAGKFRISYYDINSQRQFETWPTLEDAQRELAKRLAEVAQGIPVSSKPNLVLFGELLADVINDYTMNKKRSLAAVELRIRRHILPVFGKRKASQIATSQIRAYIVQRQAGGAKDGTINRELTVMKRAFSLAMQGRKLLVRPHVPMLRENNTRTGFFTREEVDRLCAVLDEPYRSFVLFAFLTGWRTSEIRGLQWRNVDFDANEIRLDAGTTKNGEARVFPMTTELRSLLKGLTDAGRAKQTKPKPVSKKVVSAKAPNVFNIGGLPIGEFRKTWANACKKAGLPVVIRKDGTVKAVRIPHDLRRSAARELENAGVPRSTIKELLGHKTDSMFSRYRIVSADDKRRAAEIIDGAKNGAKRQTENG